MEKTPRRDRYGLRDSPFFRLSSRKKLSKLLRLSTESLDNILNQSERYIRRWKHKKEEKWLNEAPAEGERDLYRPIDIPNASLKKIQGRIADLLSRIQAPDFLFSPVRGRSYVENAARHIEGIAFWLLDVADYFPSCTANNVARFFRKDLECSEDVTAILTFITTLNGSLPQGSPCSPILAYYSNHPMWLEIARTVSAAGCTLSIYADDITISGKVVRKKAIWEIKKIIHRSGLRVKRAKEVSLIRTAADITGVIVKDGRTLLPNRQLKRLSELKKERAMTKDDSLKRKLDAQIRGRVAQRKQVEHPRHLH